MKLSEYLKTAKFEGFNRNAYYSPEGDTIEYFIEDTDFYADRIDDLVTVFRASDGGRTVGCRMKGVRRMLKRLGDFGVQIAREGNSYLGPFFLAGMVDAEKGNRVEYEELGRAMSKVPVDTTDLQPTGCH